MSSPIATRPIRTITLNPALDLSTSVAAVTPDHKLRCARPSQEPGGGGVNVARVAGRLGCPATAVVVAGGPPGDRLLSLLRAEGVDAVAVPSDSDTRQSFAVEDRSTGRQYRFVLPGPDLAPGVLDEVEAAATGDGDGPPPIVVVSGSVPAGLPSGAFGRMIERLAERSGCEVVVDTSGDALREAIESPAALIKPSARELAAIVGRDLTTEADVSAAAEEVLARSSVGAVLASIGAGGAVLVRADGPTIRLLAPTVKVRSAVGAGDSLVGGLAVGLARGLDLEAAAALGIAAGTAAVITEGSGLCHPDAVTRLRPLVRLVGAGG